MSQPETLVTRARRLQEALSGYTGLRETSRNLAELQRRHERLETELGRLRPAATLLSQARTRGARVPALPSTEVGRALDLLVTLSQRFAKDPQVIMAPDFGTAIAAVQKAVSAVESHAHDVWKSLAVPVRDEMRTELLDALARVPTWREVTARIRKAQERIETLAATPLVTVGQFEDFFHAARERDSAWQALHGDAGIPQGIVVFLRTCAKEGMPLDQLTPEILQWLGARGILPYFRVRL